MNKFEKFLINISGFSSGVHKRCIQTKNYDMTKKEKIISRIILTYIWFPMGIVLMLGTRDLLLKHPLLGSIVLLGFIYMFGLIIKECFFNNKKSQSILFSKEHSQLSEEEKVKREFFHNGK